MHDRDIVNRLDDSVARVMAGKPRLLRRARGHAPAPMPLPPGFEDAPPILAMGGELKSTFCLLKDGQAIVSQHMGDLEEAATHADYRRNQELYRSLFRFEPQIVAVDAHPDYISTEWGRALAQENGLPRSASSIIMPTSPPHLANPACPFPPRPCSASRSTASA